MTIARTRVKICGITNLEDAIDAVDAGADALGFVFYNKSPRYIEPEKAQAIIRHLPPLVTIVGLFVNESAEVIRSTLSTVNLDRLQFHGSENLQACEQFDKPWFKAIKVEHGDSLVDAERAYPGATALLLDTPSDRHGGTGKVFDWSLIPSVRHTPLILAGGLNAENVQRSITSVLPFAVDVSSGVEQSPGNKDKQKMKEFIARVRQTDEDRIRQGK